MAKQPAAAATAPGSVGGRGGGGGVRRGEDLGRCGGRERSRMTTSENEKWKVKITEGR